MDRRIRLLVALGTLWLSLCLGGMGVLIAYSNEQGVAHPAPKRYAKDGEAQSGRYTLLMILHPKCPCSRASVNELARLMARCSDHVDATVYFFHPHGRGEIWSKTGLWRSVERIPSVQLALDSNGDRARRLGAATSGHVFLYSPGGELRFDGGITAGRGHEGDNAGRAAVTDLVEGRKSTVSHLPVFGCSIFGE